MNTAETTEQPQEELLKPIRLNFHLNGKLLLPVDMYPTDNLFDLRQFFSETSQLYFISNYHFEYMDNRLNELVEVGMHEYLENEAQIDIVIDPFDERSARYHLKKVQEFIQNPKAHQNIFGGALKAIKESQAAAQEGKEPEAKPQTAQDDKTKEETESQEKALTLNEAIGASLNTLPKISPENLGNNEEFKFVQHLIFSGFNPPHPHRKLRGDFFYLNFKTLEGPEQQVTACQRGFFLNNSTNKVYDPTPQNDNVFLNLLDLLCSTSPQCRQNLEKLVNTELKEEHVYTKPLNLYTFETKWVTNTTENTAKSYEADPTRTENFLLDLHGFDPSGIRDWNEELQVCRDFPRQNLIQRLNRDKALLKVHTDFVEAASKGAKGIVDKYIQPLNPQDLQSQQVFVYNHIFFSFVTHTPKSYTQDEGPEAAPTTSISNSDFRNLRILHRMDIPELYLLNTCIVDYKGQRVLAQTIIPGILNSDHTQCTEFGSIDEGKTIHCSEEFAEIMKKVCEYFSLDDQIECLDESGNVVTLPASPEVKGIRGSDKRKFILDLARLSPRDTNWLEQEEHLCCMIRPEAISHFMTSKNFQYAKEQIKQEMKEKNEEKKEDQVTITEEGKPTEEGQVDEKKGLTYADYINKLQEYLTQGDNKPKVRFNSNLFTRVKLHNPESEKIQAQKKDLLELGEFIYKQAIPTLVNELLNGEIILPCDSKSLSELFHAHGVNVRYLGKVCDSITKEKSPFLYILLQRVMLAKSIKHLLKVLFRQTSSLYHANLVIHVLNCIFSPKKTLKLLESGDIKTLLEESEKLEQSAPEAKGESVEDKKKKKNKKKTATKKQKEASSFVSPLIDFGSIKTETDVLGFLNLKASDIWEEIRDICKKRYNYELPQSVADFEPFKYPLTKLATLRDVCLSSGIILDCKEYQVFDKEEETKEKEQAETLPFKSQDIIDIQPVVKHLDPGCDDAKVQIDLALRLMSEEKYEEALETFWGSLQILMSIFGPVHKDVAFCYSKIANIYFKLGDMTQTIANHQQCVRILEKFYGFDNPQTAHAYSSLSLFYYTAKETEKAFAAQLKSLYIFNLIGGEFHPECAMIFTNLALMYQDIEKQQPAINCLFEALERNVLMYGAESFKVANSYQSLSLAHFDIGDYKKSVEFQQKSVALLKKVLSPEDPRARDAEIILDKIQKSIAERNTSASFQNDSSRKPFANAKSKKGKQEIEIKEERKAQDAESLEEEQKAKERERLLQKLKVAKMNAKYGVRRPGFGQI